MVAFRPLSVQEHHARLRRVYPYGDPTDVLIRFLFSPLGLFLLVSLGFLLLQGRMRGPGAQTREFLYRLFALLGKVGAHGGQFTPIQGQFLRGILAQQFGVQGYNAHQILTVLDDSFRASAGGSWSELLADTTALAQEIAEDFFLDRQTLVWVYATCRRVAALGNVRPGIVELLDAIARAFSIAEEVGSAGTGDRREEPRYEQTWQDFKPASSAGPGAYETLGLTQTASNDEVKKAYRALVRQHHPDAHSHLPDGDPVKKKASERFLQVQQAYERIRRDRKF